MLKNCLQTLVLVAFVVSVARADDAVVEAIHGTVTRVDAAAKTIVVKTADGTEHTLHFVASTSVQGAQVTATGGKDSFHGITQGSEVVAHYTETGGRDTATEVDKAGKGGMRAVSGTVTHVSADGKSVVVKAANGAEHTFEVAGNDTAASARAIGRGANKSAKVTVYYTQTAGKKVAHFFRKL